MKIIFAVEHVKINNKKIEIRKIDVEILFYAV